MARHAMALHVSVVLPCLDEENTVAMCVNQSLDSLQRARISGEVVVVDNGSRDQSACRAQAAGARVVHCDVRGYGASIRHGVACARGDWIIMADADGSYDLQQIAPFLERLADGADLVMGNRFAGGIQTGAMPWANRYIGNPCLTWLLNILYRSRIGDAHCGLRAFTRVAFQRMQPRCDGMEFASELVIRALQEGLRIDQVPTRLFCDGRGHRSHLRPWRDGWRHVRYILSARQKGTGPQRWPAGAVATEPPRQA